MSRTLLHVATDWTGHFPNGAETVAILIEAGADVNARFTGPHTETPLHWAASSNDIEVPNILLDAGAYIDASGGVIACGTPLDNAVAFGQWQAALYAFCDDYISDFQGYNQIYRIFRDINLHTGILFAK
jgi:ankyrin repeat protein